MAAVEALKAPLIEQPAEEEEDDNEQDDEPFLQPLGGSILGFRHTTQMAARTASMCVLTSLPIIVPSWYHSIDPAYTVMITSGVVEMVVFTTYSNLGITVQYAWQGFIGTLGACVVTHVLNALMPGGAAGEFYCAPLVHAVNVLVIFLGLWLNMAKNVRMFLLSWHAYFLMEFMNPNTTTIYNTTWAIIPDSYTTTTLVTSTIGVLCAIGVMLFPYPVRSTNFCRQAALESVGRLTSLMDSLVEYYNRHEASVKIAQLEEQARDLRDMIATMQADVDGAWWETLDLGRSGCRRMLLTQHVSMMKEMSDIVFALEVCLAREDFAPTHVTCMQAINEKVKQLVGAVKDLLRAATVAANDGRLDAQEKEHLEALVAKVKNALRDLAVFFDGTRRQLSPQKVITAELQSEAFFVQSLSVYARMAVEYTEGMIAKPPRPVCFLVAMFYAWLDMFNPAVLRKGADIHGFTCRNTISLVICYYIGYYLLGYSGIPAGTAALLLTDFSGSALHKNMMRLQAVCVGSILPHIITRILGQSCGMSKIIPQGFAIMGWELLTNYVYYSSSTWGYVGCLTGAFGSTVLVFPCVGNKTETAAEAAAEAAAAETGFQAASFEKMTETAIAAVVMTLVDMALMSQRASTMATEKVLEAFLALDAGMQAGFSKRKHTGACKRGCIKVRTTVELSDRAFAGRVARCSPDDRSQDSILGLLSSASTLGNEADKEPRYHRVAWPEGFFSGLVQQGYVLEANLHVLEQVLMGSDGTYSDVFGSIRDLEPFAKVRDDMLRTSEDCLHMVQAVLQNETGKELYQLVDKMNSLEKVESIDSMPELMEAINGSGLKYPAMVGSSMEDDIICRMNVALMLYESIVHTLAAIVKDCIRQAT